MDFLLKWLLPVLIMGLYFLGIGIWGLPMIQNYSLEKRSSQWMTVEATVKSSLITEGNAPCGKINYAYHLGEQHIGSNCLRMSRDNQLRLYTEQNRKDFQKIFAPGNKIRVSVNPARPEESVLFAGVTMQTQLEIAAAFALVVFGIIMMMLFMRQRKGHALPHPKRTVMTGAVLLAFALFLTAAALVWPIIYPFPGVHL